MEYGLQRVVRGDEESLRFNVFHAHCRGIWDLDRAKFTECAIPYLSTIPVIFISLIALSRFSSHSGLLKKWRPNWSKPFVPELSNEDDSESKSTSGSLGWSIALLILSSLAILVQIFSLVKFSASQLPSILLLVAWTEVSLFVGLARPRRCPASLTAFYGSVLLSEVASIKSWATHRNLEQATHHAGSILCIVSVLVLLFMPLREASPHAGPISTVGSVPKELDRSPEDKLRLWQFLTVSWVRPLLTVGKERQMENTDIWTLPYEFQNTRTAEAFRQLKGRVWKRVLVANGVDCCILIITSFITLACEFAYPLLLHELLRSMGGPNPRKQAALTYAFITWISRVISAQTSMLALWYGRRCFERSRGELIMMVYEKTLSRKDIISFEEKKKPEPVPNGEGSNSNGHVTNGAINGTANGSSQSPENGKLDGTNASANKSDAPTSTKLGLFKDLWAGKKEIGKKKEGPASTGQVLNLVQADAIEIATRFLETERLIKIPFGFGICIWLICSLLGPSCLIAVLVVVIAHTINGFLTRLLVKWRRYNKQATDERVQMNSQFIETIRHLRWYGWQDKWLGKVMAARRHELNVRVITQSLNILTYFISVLSGNIFPVAGFFAYTALAHHNLSIDLIFPALSLFASLQGRLREIPTFITNCLNAYVAMERMQGFMDEPEREGLSTITSDTGPSNDPSPPPPLILKDCTYAWPGSTVPVLHGVNLTIETGLTVVYGKIGAGKTAFLHAILGEMDQLDGEYDVPDETMAYCAQTPWLQSLSIRDNILFFTPYVEERYNKVLEACQLLTDLASFKEGDESHIGENGIGLSGGQKARVALARAMYSRSRILLLDDPISALDHDTAENIVDKCFSGSLIQDRMIILSTHRTSLVHRLANQFIRATDGVIEATSENPFIGQGGSEQLDGQAQDAKALPQSNAKTADVEGGSNPFIEEERREEGGVKAKVWLTFIKAGKMYWILLGIMMFTTRIFGIIRQWFFKAWGEAYGESIDAYEIFIDTARRAHSEFASFQIARNMTVQWSPMPDMPPPTINLKPWLILLFVIATANSLSLLAYALSQITAVYQTSKNMFAAAMVRVTHANFRFYDVTPAGRLMNRLTSDISVLDNALTYFGHTIFYTTLWISSVIVIASVSPIFLMLSLVLMAMFVYIFLQFLPASRSLKRLETVSLSPLFTHFGELLQSQGLTTVRAFRAQSSFHSSTIGIVDRYQSITHFYWSVQNWLMWRYENISGISTFALTAISLAINLSPGLTAFMLSYASSFVGSTHTLCLRFGDLQTEFVSVERIVDLLEIEQEPKGTVKPPASWPRFGSKIEFDKVTVRYAPHLDPSLTDISLCIPGGKITAVIGRTGSGKSTLAAAILNVVRAEKGEIRIDGLPLTDIEVQTLRERVTFIPQDPVLFSGTIHSNLDPTEEHSMEDCAAVLSRVCASTSQSSWTLDMPVESGGRNFSQGQRQLIGITRAVLRRSPIIILDEATASIDVETSMELQRIVREELKEATVVTVAHRVEAVRDAAWVVVLEGGRVKKEGPVGEVLGEEDAVGGAIAGDSE